jgi:hypothetical protein
MTAPNPGGREKEIEIEGIFSGAIQLHRQALEQWVAKLNDQPLDKVFWWVLQGDWGGMIYTASGRRPPDTTEHPHHEKRRFYVVVIEEDRAYEGYLYLIGNGDYHVSIVQILGGKGLADRRALADRIREGPKTKDKE